jgi:hypothetical protein
VPPMNLAERLSVAKDNAAYEIRYRVSRLRHRHHTWDGDRCTRCPALTIGYMERGDQEARIILHNGQRHMSDP